MFHTRAILIPFLILAALFITNPALAQQEINGWVKDNKTNEPLIGAQVVVKSTKENTVTDVKLLQPCCPWRLR